MPGTDLAQISMLSYAVDAHFIPCYKTSFRHTISQSQTT